MILSGVRFPTTTPLICMAGATSQIPRQALFFQVNRPSGVVSPTLTPSSLARALEHVAGAADVAGRGLAHPDDVFALGLPGVHGVKTHHPEDFAPLDVQARGDALLHCRVR